ncbi:S-layer homology domain-containing protein [Bacillus seohaeanensis]|uniref:S-layer homology domain-containing protein n=1 Tax=Bacillus seohaeanensis TaxID=284580 RepID=A0ABW5RLM5_9BACI
MDNVSYIHFKYLDATKATFFEYTHDTKTSFDLSVPDDVEINEVMMNRNKELSPLTFKPGMTHGVYFSFTELKVDGLSFNGLSDYDNFSVVYSGNDLKAASDKGNFAYYTYNLNNYFTPTFTDIATDNWAYQDILWAARKGIIQGYPTDQFKPTDDLTEGQLAMVLARYFGLHTDQEYGHRAQPIYDMLQVYNLPFKGYKDNIIKNAPGPVEH